MDDQDRFGQPAAFDEHDEGHSQETQITSRLSLILSLLILITPLAKL